MNKGIRIIFFSLILLFLWYSWNLYKYAIDTQPEGNFDKSLARIGSQVWQNNNCQACHQIYSLGGYLGPDLTNVYSGKNKGPAYIRSVVENGVKQMPGFKLSESEMTALMEFMKSADQSGIANPRNFTKNPFGMIEQKKEK